MDEYLKTLLEQIRCKKARPYIRQELQNHIEEQIEANIHAGMDYKSAEKEAVKDMGDPVETGISLDHIHRPQVAWNMLIVMALISVTGILTHIMITRHIDGGDVYSSGRYMIHILVGLGVMVSLYFIDYTVLARFSRLIAVALLTICLLALFFGDVIDGTYCIKIGGIPISIQALMLIYIPVYGGVIYKYHGSGYGGLLKSIVWMIVPVLLVWKIPSAVTAGMMFLLMFVMLIIAIQKDWFVVLKKKIIVGLAALFTVLPLVTLCGMYFGTILKQYQKMRIQTFFFDSGDISYLTVILRSLLSANKFIGNIGTDISGSLPAFNADYILLYLSSTYGMIVAILVCCLLAVLILTIFRIAVIQKNPLGMMMGFGCGMVFLLSLLINILENLGVLFPTKTFFPFLSAGGIYIIVSYGLIGIVLSIYKYKDIYPCDVNVKMPQIKTTMEC